MTTSCHCGKPVAFGFDGDPTHHRGMCAHCDSVRCDVDPSNCSGEDLLRHLDQRTYIVTPSTGVVHSLPCIRAVSKRPLPWPEFYDADDRGCTHCLPDGLPEVEQPKRDDWVLKFAIKYARGQMKEAR